MSGLRFEVPGIPVGKGRPRFVRATGRTYTPDRTVAFEDRVGFYAVAAGAVVMEGPVHLEVWAYWPCPKSKHRKRNPRPEGPRTSKPDADNVLKVVADALNGICYQDDSQITDATIRKRTAAQGQPARTVITVKEA